MAYLETKNISKRYGGVTALNNVDFSCQKGETHALLGSNGSGKSTLAKILTGLVAADEGEFYINNNKINISGPDGMYNLGIAIVYQELSLISQLSVADNIMLGHEPKSKGLIDKKQLYKTANEFLSKFSAELNVSLSELVANLDPAEQQLVEIAKALSRKPQILILDEATASLRKREVNILFKVIKELKKENCTIIFISHRMEEVFDICDRATILRDGKKIDTITLKEHNSNTILKLMTGDINIEKEKIKFRKNNKTILSVNNIKYEDKLNDISFNLNEGEILGLGGLQGQGQSELLQLLFGLRKNYQGLLKVQEKNIQLKNPKKAIKNKIYFVPGNRAKEGLFLQRSILENITLPTIDTRTKLTYISEKREKEITKKIAKELDIQHSHSYQKVSALSGGNQQKVVIGKWLVNTPKILLLDDPTKGVDIKAKNEIFSVIRNLSKQGIGIIFNSSDNSELISLCDRVIILYEGEIVDELAAESLNEENLIASGLRI